MNLRLVALFIIVSTSIHAQQKSGGEVHGSFQTDFQFYQPDEDIGVTDSTLNGRNTGMNSFLNLIYINNNFEAGARIESYFPPLQGYSARYEGIGLAHRYAKIDLDEIEITAGNFYEQFGSGLILRSYQEWNLGYDNSFDGLRIKYAPYKGIYIKALAGVQRLYWDKWTPEDDRGIVKGIDGEVNINELFKKFSSAKSKLILGFGFVSKYQKDQHPIYYMPENVAAFSGRINYIYGNFSLLGEYAYKINDPSADNGNIYKPGDALFLNTTYAKKGFSVQLGMKRIDNMSFRSDRSAGLADLSINYMPAISKQHVYTLPAMYPYATQLNGEYGVNATISYKIKKGSKIGGKYGTQISVNYSRINSLKLSPIDANTPIGTAGTLGYSSDFFVPGDDLYFEDLNVEIYRKFNKNFKITAGYDFMSYNIDVIEGHAGEEMVKANVGYASISWKLAKRRAIKFELQYLDTKQDDGSWMLALVEYTNKSWFVSLMDQYNSGNPHEDEKLHYYTASAGFSKKATRIAVNYGRQREGIVCVGGVCRLVPAASGVTLSITTSF